MSLSSAINRADRVAELTCSYVCSNMVPVHWTSAQFGMPIKTDDTPFALFTPKELYLMLSAFFISVFMRASHFPS